jgi:hypothetical protein
MALAPTKKQLLEILPDEHVKELIDAVEGAIDYWLLPDPDLDRLRHRAARQGRHHHRADP